MHLSVWAAAGGGDGGGGGGGTGGGDGEGRPCKMLNFGKLSVIKIFKHNIEQNLNLIILFR